MKKVFGYVLVLLMLLAGCGTKGVNQTEPPETTAPAATEAVQLTDPPEETTCPAGTEVPAEVIVEVPDTKPDETGGENSGKPHLLKIDRADQSIYEGPGYDYVFVDIVRERGTYTIVEEALDVEGNLWGKLKSGIGWVDLTQIRSEEYAAALISANYADENLLLHGDYYHYAGNEAEYRTSVAFRAYGKLRNVEICSYDFVEDDFVMGDPIFTLPELTPEMPLVAELAFPGDMSMYGIRFVDETGNTHIYSIYISGRNGALVLECG